MVAPRRTGLQESSRLAKRKRTRMTIYTYNARTLASDAAIEDLIMQAGKFTYEVIGLTETRRRHQLNAVYDNRKELFLGTTVKVLVKLASSSTRVWQSTSTLSNTLQPGLDVYGRKDVVQRQFRQSSSLTLQHQATMKKKSKHSIWT
ncbi:hypothetical protein RB195_003122 [Necator americanus]|uniref:Uncharacterized protein n=1 Tax=Necator americanus TaxID=51031 RepID=A0ABR1DM46_NECAM